MLLTLLLRSCLPEVAVRVGCEVICCGTHPDGTCTLLPPVPLQVRLLTGIGRFHEMSYIIAQLLENDEFESLLHKGVEKVCGYC